jgi:hypothetical protein
LKTSRMSLLGIKGELGCYIIGENAIDT